ncbi:hypothetical protein BLOT_013175 [Blomia tropicalis]|nr:hypothetical protein BLOT_013175 [Blomia tropicalis]
MKVKSNNNRQQQLLFRLKSMFSNLRSPCVLRIDYSRCLNYYITMKTKMIDNDNLKIKDEIIFDSIPLDGDGDDQNLTRVEHNDVGDPSQGRVEFALLK